MSIKIKRHLQATCPEISDLLDQVKTIPKLRRQEGILPEAIVRVVTGQMLSSTAAQTIYQKIIGKAAEKQLVGSWLLDHESLRACGLSGSKARTVCEFGSRIGPDISALDHWYALPAEKLLTEIKSHRGMGDWTASIIGLFYVGHEDIFPTSDGSLQRAIRLIEQANGKRRKQSFNPDRAAPYRSYLALYLWECLDKGMLEMS